MLALARELAQQGNIVRFYSYVPKKRALQFGLKEECHYGLFYFALPFLLLYKLFGFRRWNQYLYQRCCDIFMSFYMKPCDIFIGESPIFNKAARAAKRKYHAITILETGTIHAREFERIFNTLGMSEHKEVSIKRYEESYQEADFISVGCTYAKQTFTERNISTNKIVINSYGFEPEQFNPTALSAERAYDCIYVGNWSKNKGSLIYEEFFRQRTDLTFLHIGAIREPFPNNLPNMQHINFVPQDTLESYYSQARVFLMLSYLEGFGMVITQAMACGLPIVSTRFTGAIDLQQYTKEKDWIQILENQSIDDISQKIDKALSLSRTQNGKRNYTTCNFRDMSWKAYGSRYNNFLKQIQQNHLSKK